MFLYFWLIQNPVFVPNDDEEEEEDYRMKLRRTEGWKTDERMNGGRPREGDALTPGSPLHRPG